VAEVLFALCTVVKVFADSTLVTDTGNWGNSATVALDALVHDKTVLGLLDGLLAFDDVFFVFHELVEKAGDGGFKLITDQVLNGLAGHVGSTAATLALLSFLAFALLAPVVVGVLVTEIGLNVRDFGLVFFLKSNLLDGLFNWLFLLGFGNNHVLDNGLRNLLDGLNGFGGSSMLVLGQLDEELHLHVAAEGNSVSHLQVLVISDLDLVVVNISVEDFLFLLAGSGNFIVSAELHALLN